MFALYLDDDVESEDLERALRLHVEFLGTGRDCSGIIVLGSQHTPIGEQARQIARLAERYSSADMVNRIEWIRRRPSPDA